MAANSRTLEREFKSIVGELSQLSALFLEEGYGRRELTSFKKDLELFAARLAALAKKL